MKYLKEIKKYGNSINIISLTQKELEQEGLKVGDKAEICFTENKFNAYVCNSCQNKIFVESKIKFDPESKISCNWCNNIQFFKDTISFEDWKKELRRKK